MKIYTEVVYHWDDAKGELVEESSKSFDYHGPLTLCWVQAIPYIIAGVQLAISTYGIYKGQQAAEEDADAKREHQARVKALAIKKYEDYQGITAWNKQQLEFQKTRLGDIEKEALLFKTIERKKIEGTIAAKGGMYGKSSDFYMDKITGDLLRGQDALKTDFLVKKMEIHAKQESVVRGLRTARINMQYTIAGLSTPSDPNTDLMWLQMSGAALDAYKTYHTYSKPKANPDLNYPTTGGGGQYGGMGLSSDYQPGGKR